MQTNPKTLQSQINANTETSGGPGAQGAAAKESLPAAEKYAIQIVSSQMGNRTDPRRK